MLRDFFLILELWNTERWLLSCVLPLRSLLCCYHLPAKKTEVRDCFGHFDMWTWSGTRRIEATKPPRQLLLISLGPLSFQTNFCCTVLPHFCHSGPIPGSRCVDDGLQLSFLGPGFCRLQSVTLSFPGIQPGNIHDMILPGGLTTWTWSCSTRWSDVFCQPLRPNLLNCTGCLHVLQMGCSTGFPPVAQLWCGLGISRVPLSRAVSWSRVGKLVAFYWKPQNVRAPILTFKPPNPGAHPLKQPGGSISGLSLLCWDLL